MFSKKKICRLISKSDVFLLVLMQVVDDIVVVDFVDVAADAEVVSAFDDDVLVAVADALDVVFAAAARVVDVVADAVVVAV